MFFKEIIEVDINERIKQLPLFHFKYPENFKYKLDAIYGDNAPDSDARAKTEKILSPYYHCCLGYQDVELVKDLKIKLCSLDPKILHVPVTRIYEIYASRYAVDKWHMLRITPLHKMPDLLCDPHMQVPEAFITADWDNRFWAHID